MSSTRLEDVRIHVRFKLAALWTSLMFCYIYGDYFNLYQPGKLQGMLDGRMDPLGPITQAMLLGTALLLAIPALMVVLSLVLPAALSRWTNIMMGIAYTLVMAVTMPGAWMFYLFLGVVEMLLTLAVAWYAWRWPRQAMP